MLSSQLEIVQQAKDFLQQISKDDYCAVMGPHLTGSVGAHLRHVIDHYQALYTGYVCGLVDYNQRNRSSEVEHCPQKALQALTQIELWLTELCAEDTKLPVDVISEASISTTINVTSASTLARELLFVSSHAIHHFSLMAVIRSLQQKTVDPAFGVAPATASFRR